MPGAGRWLSGLTGAIAVFACCSDGDMMTSTALVTRVLDGDTVELEDGQQVRYLGVDTPEVKSNDCYAMEAKNFNEQLVLGKEVILEADPATDDVDQFGRLLRYVSLETAAGERLVNLEILQKGYGWVFMASGLAHKPEFDNAEAAAKAAKAGLWGQCEGRYE